MKEELKRIKKNHHHLPHLHQIQVNLKKKNMIVVAVIAVYVVIAKISDKHPRMKYSVAVVLFLWVFGLLVFSLFLLQFI